MTTKLAFFDHFNYCYYDYDIVIIIVIIFNIWNLQTSRGHNVLVL